MRERLETLRQLAARNMVKAAAVGAVVIAPVAAHAQATAAQTAFNDALTAATTDIGVYGIGLVLLSAAGVGFMIAVKYVKKLRGAS